MAGFTDVRSGNLARHVGDDPETVEHNRAAVLAQAGAQNLLFANQIHSDVVVLAESPWDTPPDADAIVTTTPGLFLAVMVADCVPVVLLSDEVVGVAHAGRAGMTSNIVTATVEVMRRAGAGEISAFLGPSVCARCYEVPELLRDQCSDVVPYAASVTRHGTPSLDLAAGVTGQLAAAGVAVQILPGCTMEDESLFSHRRQAGTGRFIGLAGLR